MNIYKYRLEELKTRVTLQLVDSLRVTGCAAVSELLAQVMLT